ncbi:MAG TPA: hypothetical protein VGM87_00810 [Roseomonas sp.]|jgi:hypothetical protein
MPRYAINYPAIMSDLRGQPLAAVKDRLAALLPDLWCEAYTTMSRGSVGIVEVPLDSYIYLFDMTRERVVVAYGTSAPNPEKRDSSRMAGWLGKISDRFRGRGDKGHGMSHRQGGGLDINLFPQRADVNRGRSEQGKHYRALERYCATHAETFCFSRLLYDNQDWVPNAVEYGVLKGARQFQVERFTNAPV